MPGMICLLFCMKNNLESIALRFMYAIFLIFCYRVLQPCVRLLIKRVRRACKTRKTAEVYTIIKAIAAAGAMSPASSMFNTATDASIVSGEYRKTTAETVVIAFRNR